jgi:hypothetical protein
VNVLVSPEVREEDFPGVRSDICKRIKDVTGKEAYLISIVARAMRVLIKTYVRS